MKKEALYEIRMLLWLIVGHQSHWTPFSVIALLCVTYWGVLLIAVHIQKAWRQFHEWNEGGAE